MNEINLNHICKIEGHAHLKLRIEENKVIECQLKAAEGARFFEALVINKKLEDIQEIVSRICGICSSAHSVASIQALEEALKLKPTQEQVITREMLMIGERIRSHATHLYFLCLPDYFDKESILDMSKEHKDKINDALKIISVGNKIVEAYGGREMHPFMKIQKEKKEINKEELIESLDSIKPAIIKTIGLFSSLNYRDLQRETDYLSLKEEGQYANISGKIYSNNSKFIDDLYKENLQESIKEYSTSKFVTKNGRPYMLGAMARINNNHENLDEETKKILHETLKKMNLALPLKNPFHNIICQSIELLESLNRAKNLLLRNVQEEKTKKIKIREGHGVSSVEAPRGTLFHDYKIDKKGTITYCNIITPTAQNLNMMEVDIKSLVEELLSKKTEKEKIVKEIEKLIRAYDPCFSCSTHFLKVEGL